jgi:hypothetical protein
MPFLWLIAAAALPWWRRRWFTFALLLLLLLWYAAGSLSLYPHYLPTFNELAGGPANGYRILGDSNIDWGQDLHLLAAYAAEQDERTFNYSYFGAADPDYYGLSQPSLSTLFNASSFSPANPPAGRYALSVNHVQGLLEQPDLLDWFWRREPSGNLGYSILLYEIPEAASGAWIAHCLDPAPLLSPDEALGLLGLESARHVYFDCRNGWVFPDEAQPGWYILPQQAEPWPIPAYFPGALQPVYAHAHTATAPSYEVYYWSGGAELFAGVASATARARLPDGTAVTLPTEPAENTARLLGYLRPGPGRWLTFWEAQAPEPGLAVSAHLYAGSAEPLIADGLAFSSEQWAKGDIFVQYHTFTLPDAASPAESYLATGIYSFHSGEQYPFSQAGQTVPQIHLLPPTEE